MERNIKLFPIYKLFSYDILFFYAIQTLYLMEIKNLTISQIGMISSFYCLFYLITTIPASIICDKLGLKKSLLIGNLLLVIYCIFLMILPSYNFLILNELICSIGFALKGCAESPFIYSSLKKVKREDELSKVEGKGDSLYFILEAVACIIAGYLYNIDSYLPLIFSTLCFAISSILCYTFKPIPRNNKNTSAKSYFGELKSGFKFIFKSKRLRALLLFSLVFVSNFYVASFLLKAFLSDLNTSSQVFGYIYALMSVSSALGALVQRKVEKKLKNHTLTSIALIFITTIVFTGIFMFFGIPTDTLIIIGTVFFCTQALIKGMFWIIIKTYLSRYTTSSIRPKIMSIYNLVRNFGTFAFLSLVTPLVDIISLPLCFVLVGFAFFIIIILVAAYMNNKVGLDPSKYTEKDRFDLKEQNITSNK